ncbi:DUF6873 family GME fold protein [Fonticella tunisiensis]|uniref:DUF6873 domain-containing protein n=1 Tax=Fonticella tunisiensis TaxID=1096341 RepID=A0A4R7KPK7_9CLOT|nr:hypothetical protein [Fonticella tunisiensis]TDT61051.1 hypothetical protein EDD71_10958 [Fonticella tunisiensis]
MESFIKEPNLPEGKASLCVVDGRIPLSMEKNLKNRNIRLIKTERMSGVYDAISCHPDIMLHHLGGDEIVVAPNIPERIVYNLEDEGFKIITGAREVGCKYPFDVPYNAARFGRFVVCNTKYTDEVLLEKFLERGLHIIDVKQGYAKCSLCVVSSDSIITSDRGVHNILIKNEIKSLLITPGGIDLFGLNYGFIGGASGCISGDSIAFYGNIKMHPDYDAIEKFLKNSGKNPINLNENTPVDLGTLIPLKEYSILMP